MEEIIKYFPNLSNKQVDQLQKLGPLYREWNDKINVISRKDMDLFYVRHVLHSLAIAKFVSFSSGTKIMDIGTGGGFPGIPLAIFFPDCDFLLVDSIEKKIKVVNDVIQKVELENTSAYRGRVEDVNKKFHFVTCRAVAHIEKLMKWTSKKYLRDQTNVIPNGLLALKGGDLQEELATLKTDFQSQKLSSYYSHPFFETKKLIYVQNR